MTRDKIGDGGRAGQISGAFDVQTGVGRFPHMRRAREVIISE